MPYERNARQIEQTNASIQNQQQRLDELGNELRDAGVDTDRLTEENDRLADSYNRVRPESGTACTPCGRAAEKRRRNLKDKGAACRNHRRNFGGGRGDLRGAGAAIHKVSILYGKGWNDCGHGGASLECTSKGYSQPFKRNRVNANDIAEDVYNAISAGQKTEDAVGFVGQAVKLAKGGFAETGQALDVMTTILNAYGKESSEAGAVADMLIQTQNKGKVTVAELSSVMGKIIPTANANNVALEQPMRRICHYDGKRHCRSGNDHLHE